MSGDSSLNNQRLSTFYIRSLNWKTISYSCKEKFFTRSSVAYLGPCQISVVQALACNFTKSNNPPWVFFTFFKLCEWYQIAQRTASMIKLFCENSQRKLCIYHKLKIDHQINKLKMRKNIFWQLEIFTPKSIVKYRH